jgi:hypothetical protein
MLRDGLFPALVWMVQGVGMTGSALPRLQTRLSGRPSITRPKTRPTSSRSSSELRLIGLSGHAESFLLWLRISKKFSGIILKKWSIAPVSSATLHCLSSVLERRFVLSPRSAWSVTTRWRCGRQKIKSDLHLHRLPLFTFHYLTQSTPAILCSRRKFGNVFNNAVLSAAERLLRVRKHRLSTSRHQWSDV